MLIAMGAEVMPLVARPPDDWAEVGVAEEPTGEEAGSPDPATAQGVEDRPGAFGIPVAREDQREPLAVARPADDGPAIAPGASPIADDADVSQDRDAGERRQTRHPPAGRD